MIKASILSKAIANTWDQMAFMLGNDRVHLEHKLITYLRRLEGAEISDQEIVIQAILDLFTNFDAVYKHLIQEINHVSSSNKGVNSQITSEEEHKGPHAIMPVFYGTDRDTINETNAPTSYGSNCGNLAIGIAEVSIPDDHRMGKIEGPVLWKLKFRKNPEKHVVVLGVEPLNLSEFKECARGMLNLNHNTKKEVLLFVHGFNVGFADAVSRTAQIVYDLEFKGIPALYSWPSEGLKRRYMADVENVQYSQTRFAQFLKIVRENLDAENVHIIAHSMGNRLVAETLASLVQPTNESCMAHLGQIMFAAPDIDARRFKDLVKDFHPKAERFTLYASSKDKALRISKGLNKHCRAGESGPDLVVVDSVDTIDATDVDTSLLGHSYYAENRLLSDFFQLIQNGSPPEERFSLKLKKKYGKQYWRFSP